MSNIDLNLLVRNRKYRIIEKKNGYGRTLFYVEALHGEEWREMDYTGSSIPYFHKFEIAKGFIEDFEKEVERERKEVYDTVVKVTELEYE